MLNVVYFAEEEAEQGVATEEEYCSEVVTEIINALIDNWSFFRSNLTVKNTTSTQKPPSRTSS